VYDVKLEEAYSAVANTGFAPLKIEVVQLKALALCDEFNTQTEDYYSDVDHWISEAEKTMRWLIERKAGNSGAKFKTFIRYVLVTFLVFAHAVIGWGEICFIPTFKKDWEWILEYGRWDIMRSYVKENWGPVTIMMLLSFRLSVTRFSSGRGSQPICT
jgi:hypothetical protein